MLWFNCKEDILKHTNFNMSCFSSRKNILQCVKQPHWCWLKPKVDIHVRGPFRMIYFLIISTFRPMSSQLCYVSHAAARMGSNAMQCMNISAGSHAMGAMLSLLSCTVLGLGAAAFQLDMRVITIVQLHFGEKMQILLFLLPFSTASLKCFCLLRKIPDLILIIKWR